MPEYYLVLYIADNKGKLTGTYQTTNMPPSVCMQAISDLRTLPHKDYYLDAFGLDAHPVAAVCWMRQEGQPDTDVARSLYTEVARILSMVTLLLD
jgi:hypothetical protein